MYSVKDYSLFFIMQGEMSELSPLHGFTATITVETNMTGPYQSISNVENESSSNDINHNLQSTSVENILDSPTQINAQQNIEKILDSPTDPRGKFLRGLRLSVSECVQLDLLPFLESIPRTKRVKYGKRRSDLSDAERTNLIKSRNREHAQATRERRKVFMQILERSLSLSNHHLNDAVVIDYLTKNQYDHKDILARHKQALATSNTSDIHDNNVVPSVDTTITTNASNTLATTITDDQSSSPGSFPHLFSHFSDMDIQHDIDILSDCIDTDFPFGDIDFSGLTDDDFDMFFRDDGEGWSDVE